MLKDIEKNVGPYKMIAEEPKLFKGSVGQKFRDLVMASVEKRRGRYVCFPNMLPSIRGSYLALGIVFLYPLRRPLFLARFA